MPKIVPFCLGALLLCLRMIGQSTAADNATHERMRELGELSKWGHEQSSQKSYTPLLAGPDDDPTLAADTIQHEAPPASRKIASHAEHLAKSKNTTKLSRNSNELSRQSRSGESFGRDRFKPASKR